MSFTADIKIGESPLVVQFTDTTPGATSWEWDFGDNTLSSIQNPTHTYYLEGAYTVVQTAYFIDGSSSVTTKTTFIIALPGETTEEERCLRMATEANEGIGWSELIGDHLVRPMANFGAFKVLDANSTPRMICFDSNDFRVYEIDTCDRVLRYRPSPVDKEGIENAEISWRKKEGEMVFSTTEEHKFIEHDCSYIHVRPEDPNVQRGMDGYTASGLRNMQQLTLKAYVEGELTSPAATASDFPESGEVVFSGRQVKNNRVQMEVSGTAGEIVVLNHVHHFLGSNEAKESAKRLMTEHEIQRSLSTDLLLHICRGHNPLFDRISGEIMTCSGVASRTIGPDGRLFSGINVTGDVNCGEITVDGDFTILWFRKSVVPIMTWGTAYVMTTYPMSSGGWYLDYTINSQTILDNFIFWGLEPIDIFGVRIYNKFLTDEEIEYLYNDVMNGGRATC